MQNRTTNIPAVVFLYGILHGLVDAASMSLFFFCLWSGGISDAVFGFLLYGIVAFGLQLPFGYLVDRVNRPKWTLTLGIFLLAAAPSLLNVPTVALLLACLGNALFHVTGGHVVLSLSRGKAAMPGIYVAPGTLGASLGALLGSRGFYPQAFWVVLPVLAAVPILFLNASEQEETSAANPSVPKRRTPFFEAGILLFCGCIACRSSVDILFQKMNFTAMSALFITLAAFFGKIGGGILADRFGWHRFTLFALLIALVIMAFAPVPLPFLVVGLFFLNTSMPVTLAAVSNFLPHRPGLAFGITAFAMILGAFAVFRLPADFRLISLSVFCCILLFHLGIRHYNVYAGKFGEPPTLSRREIE